MMFGPWLDKLVAIGTRMAVALENIAKEATEIRHILESRQTILDIDPISSEGDETVDVFRCLAQQGCSDNEPHDHLGRMKIPKKGWTVP